MNARQKRQWYWIGCVCCYACGVVTSFLAPQSLGWVKYPIMVILFITATIFADLAGRAELHLEKENQENHMNGRIISLFKHLKPYGALAAALSQYFLALVLLFFRLHDLGLLAGLFAVLSLFIGSFYLWVYLSRWQHH